MKTRLEEQRALVFQMKRELDPFLLFLEHNDDKLLFLDLLRLCVDGRAFSSSLLESVGTYSLRSYRKLTQVAVVVRDRVKEQVRSLYHQSLFPLWRKEHFKSYLKKNRAEEKRKKTYAHPYTDYLKKAESKLFQIFWDTHQATFIETYLFGKFPRSSHLHPLLFHLACEEKGKKEEALSFLRDQLSPLPPNDRRPFLETMHRFSTLKECLWGYYPSLTKGKGKQTLEELAGAFYPKGGFGYSRSYAYGQSAPQGSLFKLVTGYEALKQTYQRQVDHSWSPLKLNPLTIFDTTHPNIITKNGMVLGKTLDGKWITRHYKGGRLPRSHANLGKVDFYTAFERSSNIYFSLLASEVIDHPSDLYRTAKDFGFGKQTGIPLVGEKSGYVPDDIRDNQTSLYAFAIGQHSFEATPLQSALMLATFANKGEVLSPQIVKGEKKVKQKIFLPDEVRNTLLESMRRVVWGERGGAQPYRIRTLHYHPKWIADYKKLKNRFIGKTSTAEFAYRPTLDREMPPLICKDTWFGSISFEESSDLTAAEPELVVIVYLRFGSYGKEAAPLAAQIVKKWREINGSYSLAATRVVLDSNLAVTE